MDRIRIVIFKNAQIPCDGKQVLMDPSWNREQMLSCCSETLGIKAKKIFNETGNQLSSIKKVAEGTTLYISQGESFQVKAQVSPPKISKNYVICMLGTAAVGKSALTQRFVQDIFLKDYDPTIEDYYRKVVTIDKESVPVSILDTAGMEDYWPLIDDWIDKKDGFVLVYSVEWPDSLRKLEGFHEKILHRYSNLGNKSPCVVVAGNKIDSANRAVSLEDGRKFADKIGAKHFEVSAAAGTGVNEVYHAILRELLSRRLVSQPKVKKAWYESCMLL